MTTFRQLLEQFDESAKTTAAKGRRFERFVRSFLRADPYWSQELDQVWAWDEWPGRGNMGDTGIDLVARQRSTGNLIAIQCKFYSPSATLAWGHLGTFIGSLGHDEFSEGVVISTAGSESSNLLKNFAKAPKPVSLWRVDEFEDSRVDWDQFRIDKPAELALRTPKVPRPHQEKAIVEAIAGLETNERGQMIMACGTGKTLTALRLAERMVGAGGSVLFMVPSINLLSQSVLAWANDAEVPLSTFAVCSDARAGARSDEDMSLNDLAFPASTDAEALSARYTRLDDDQRMRAVFCTYQSVDVITEAQKFGVGEFDLIICDEAHRTTGAFKMTGEQSSFTKIHDDVLVRGRRRLYMTATPRIYGDQTQAKAAQDNVVLASMDDEACFGPVLHELGFGEAVARNLLADYRVLVLAVNEDAVSGAFQRQLADDGHELSLNDVARIIGCWHGLSKRGPQFGDDNVPMRRAVAFSSTIAASKKFTTAFPDIVNAALEDRADPNAVKIEAQHVDGKTNVKVRSEAIAWLEEPPGQRVCRVLSNAKCLTEGVDVPALDSVLFLNPRKSIVDVVQAVGRVMRRAEGKEYGYVILPIGIPAGVAPEDALRDNEKYQVVWQVLQALRSHDERLAAEVNKIDINGSSSKVSVIGIGVGGGGADVDSPSQLTSTAGEQGTLEMPDLQEWRDALYARIVEKVGDRRYMEQWAKDISSIAQAQESRIRALLSHPDQNPQAVARFADFLGALRQSLNDGITEDDAIGMLSQHLITRPVFEALFGAGDFTKRNPVSKVMQGMVDELDAASVQDETRKLEGFYEHVRMLVGGIETAEGRQRVITELYEKFFKRALPKTSESLGIVYTPIEIVDFINRGADELLRKHFDGASLSDEGVHILDPFTGTGTFIVRMLQSGLIRKEDLARKYRSELHANEIMLLAYYIAAINIETAYEGLTATKGGLGEYEPFEGIVLTDTFALSEGDHTFDRVFFPSNNERADKQRDLDIRVIVANPPYSVGQTNQNDNNQNQKYPTLDKSIEATYIHRSSASLTKSMYDSYVRAFRWASNRLLSAPQGGIAGFVSNGGWLDGNSADGMRHTIGQEFHHVYIFNLRGNQRTAGEESRREGGKVFGSGSRNTVAITFLVKEPGPAPAGGAEIHYRDIGDYLTRDEKLAVVREATVAGLPWTSISPNKSADWISLRDDRYASMLPLSGGDEGIFLLTSGGLLTSRDAWVYGSSARILDSRVRSMVDFFNSQSAGFRRSANESRKEALDRAKAFVVMDSATFKWDESDFAAIARGDRYEIDEASARIGMYRPFFVQNVIFQRELNNSVYQLPRLFPHSNFHNVGFSLVGSGSAVPFGVISTDRVPDRHIMGAGSGTSFYSRWVGPKTAEQRQLLDVSAESSRVSNISPGSARIFKSAFGSDITDDEVFSYVYGVLHSPDFRETFAVSLKKEAPRIPLVGDRATFDAFAAAGQELLDLHVGYETLDPYPLTEEWAAGADPETNPDVLLVGSSKMKYPKVKDPETGKNVSDRTRLIYNNHLTISGIPLRAHDYVLGTRSGIDWIIDRWYVKTDKKSGIVNDVNQWGLERGEPRYIIDLIGRVTALSVRTADIVDDLPKLTF